MSLLPPASPADGQARFTGLACPDCSGVLVMRTHQRLVTFACRIGHIYSPAELLTSKEEILERRLWIVFSALDELALLLEDLEHQALAREDEPAHRRRAAAARQHAATVRAIIETDRPIVPREAAE